MNPNDFAEFENSWAEVIRTSRQPHAHVPRFKRTYTLFASAHCRRESVRELACDTFCISNDIKCSHFIKQTDNRRNTHYSRLCRTATQRRSKTRHNRRSTKTGQLIKMKIHNVLMCIVCCQSVWCTPRDAHTHCYMMWSKGYAPMCCCCSAAHERGSYSVTAWRHDIQSYSNNLVCCSFRWIVCLFRCVALFFPSRLCFLRVVDIYATEMNKWAVII